MGLVLVFYLFIPLAAQDLQTAWSQYLSSSDKFESAVRLEAGWLQDQGELRAEIKNLEERENWYNEWLIKYVINRKLAVEVQIADSLKILDQALGQLRTERDESFKALKDVYSTSILSDGGDAQRVQFDTGRTAEFHQLLLANASEIWEFPDYSLLLNSDYDNALVKSMVLADLSKVIESKLITLDSLVAEKSAEVVLIERLEEFQADLGYQLESNIESGSASESNTEVATNSDGRYTDDAAATFGGSEQLDKLPLDPIPLTDAALKVDGTIPGFSTLPQTSLADQIMRLQLIQQYYYTVLAEIESKLDGD
ncbi:hypothetical protein ACFL6E_07015 [Candidatus Neomarinimicrobiota bacterium]